MLKYHDVTNHEREAEDRDDEELLEMYGYYRDPDGGDRKLLTNPQWGQDHRSWRRAVIRECLSRGLIDADPMDAP